MPDFFDDPTDIPDPSAVLPAVRRAARRRRTRSLIVACGTTAVVLAGAGIALGASQLGGSNPVNGLTTTHSPSPSPSPARPRPEPSRSRGSAHPSTSATHSNQATRPPTGAGSPPATSPPAITGLAIAGITRVHGGKVTLVVRVSGHLPQLYDAISGKPVPTQYTEVDGTSVDWGDGSAKAGSDPGQVACHAHAPIVTLPPETFSYGHTYSRPGTYTVRFEAGACPSDLTPDGPVHESLTVTVR